MHMKKYNIHIYNYITFLYFYEVLSILQYTSLTNSELVSKLLVEFDFYIGLRFDFKYFIAS